MPVYCTEASEYVGPINVQAVHRARTTIEYSIIFTPKCYYYFIFC